ncbi:MAG: DNA polymerase I [Synechococcales cyanobacterium RM1_1_8]|nr:DNA polymerase I [Synechococcales cyanobacterium RM1_1_8]
MPVSADAPVLLLVDGHSLAFRSYYAFANGRDGGLRTKTGIPTSVTFGFTKALLDTMVFEQPKALALAFDLGGPSFRHDKDETYKANRSDPPDDFRPDVDNLTALLEDMDLPIFVQPGYEADDVLGTLAQKGVAAGYRVKILSGDRDLFQLVDDDRGISILYMSTSYGKSARSSSNVKEYQYQDVVEKLGIPPRQVIDYKALCGDTSDNIPGVKGVGNKTALDLLKQFPTLEDIYAAVDADLPEIKPAIKKKLLADREAAFHSRWLATIPLDVAIEKEFENCCELKGLDGDRIAPHIEKLELQFLGSQLQKLQEIFGGEPIPGVKPMQPQVKKQKSEWVDPETDFFSPEETDAAMANRTEVSLKPQVVDTTDKLAALVKQLAGFTDPNNPVAWDTETTALAPRDAELVGIGCCWGSNPGDAAYIPLGHSTLGSVNLALSPTLDALRPILESEKYPKALQNAKFDRLILKHQGINLQGVVFDTMLASYLINPDDSHKLENIAQRYLGFSSQQYDQLDIAKGGTIADLPVEAVAEYCGMDVYATYCLVGKLQEALADLPDIEVLLLNVEQPLEPVLAEMEDQGIRIDVAYLKQFSKQLEADLQAIEIKAYEVAGEEFNLASPKQLSELLFNKLGLDTKKSSKTKTGGYSTNVTVLEKLQGDHPVIDCILDNRTLAKLKSTYVDKLPKLVRKETGRVHTDFNQAVTATGRLSSSNPNLQNIPIRTAFSRQIRKAFIPQEGWLLAAADYSQVELRILTHLSQEQILLDAYRNGDDIHALTARLLLDLDEGAEISKEERRIGKIINFGVIYGMGAHRLARETGVAFGEAKGFLDRYHDRYPKVFGYLQRMEQEAIAQGYVTTIMGRRRYVNFQDSKLQELRGQDPASIDLARLKPRNFDAATLRAAANAPIQGSSADIIKKAMVELHEQLKPYQGRLLLQVHDELVFELPPEEWPVLEPLIKQTMENAVQLSIPLQVDISAGENWMEAK